jgi:uncharacterized protein (DUF3820 family)
MKYLVKLDGAGKPTGKAHIRLGGDTACRMLSTGGLKQRRKPLTTDDPRGLAVCRLCLEAATGGRAEIPAVMPFGLHKGKPMSAVPTGYLEWLRDRLPKPPDFIHAVLALRWETEHASRVGHREQVTKSGAVSDASPASA